MVKQRKPRRVIGSKEIPMNELHRAGIGVTMSEPEILAVGY